MAYALLAVFIMSIFAETLQSCVCSRVHSICAVETAHMEMQDNWADLESALCQTECDKSDYEHTVKDLERSAYLCLFICVPLDVFSSAFICVPFLRSFLFLSSFVVMM